MIEAMREALHTGALVFCSFEPSVQLLLILAVAGCGVALLPARRS